MADTRTKAIEDLDRLLVAVDELTKELVAAKRLYRKAGQSLRAGDKVATALAKAQAGEVRESVIISLDEFERCRHASRMSLIAAGLEDGMTISSLSKAWGVSRQLISRYVNLIRNNGLRDGVQ